MNLIRSRCVSAICAVFVSFAAHAATDALVYAETNRDETTIWRSSVDGERAAMFRVAHASAWNPTVSLSPDGRHAAILAVTEGSLARIQATALVVADLMTGEARVLDHDVDVHVAAVWLGNDALAYVQGKSVIETRLDGVPRVAASFDAAVVMPVPGNDVRALRDVVWYVGGTSHRMVSIDGNSVRELRQLDAVPYDELTQQPTRPPGPQSKDTWIQFVAERDVPFGAGGFFDARRAAAPKSFVRTNAVCPQPVAYGYQPYPPELIPTFDQAARNQLGSAGPALSPITKGLAPSATSVPFSVPRSIIKAVGYAEAWQIWKQFNTAYGTFGYTGMSQSGDCGYGIMQITYGMGGGAGYDPARVAADLTYNIGTGAFFLRDGWQSSGVIGDRNPAVYEHWYHAVMRYNGVSDLNNPANPIYASPLPAYNGSNRTALPYQEVVWSLIRDPYTAKALYQGAPLWDVVPVTSPPRTWYSFPLGSMPNTPSPTPLHTETTQPAGGGTTQGSGFYTISPCRLIDSRNSTPLASSATRTVIAAGACGIPANAKALAVNVTAIAPSASGFLRLSPAGTAPNTSTMNYRTGKTRAASSISPLSPTGALDAFNSGPSPVHFVIDVTGYFQ